MKFYKFFQFYLDQKTALFHGGVSLSGAHGIPWHACRVLHLLYHNLPGFHQVIETMTPRQLPSQAK